MSDFGGVKKRARAREQAAARAGSAVASSGAASSTSQFSLDSLGGSLHRIDSDFLNTQASQNNWYNKTKYTNQPAPAYAQYVTPGRQARSGQEMFRGWIVPYTDTTAYGNSNPYRFTFPYNPDTVNIGASSMDNTALALQPLDSTARNILAVGGSVGLTFLVDRQLEVLQNTQSRYTGPGGTKNFRDFGTMYDIEFLYRVFNGPPDPGWHGPVPYSADYGFLMPTACFISLSKSLRWYAYPTNLTIQHTKLTPGMVPLTSQISLQLTTILGNPDQALLGTVRDVNIKGTKVAVFGNGNTVSVRGGGNRATAN